MDWPRTNRPIRSFSARENSGVLSWHKISDCVYAQPHPAHQRRDARERQRREESRRLCDFSRNPRVQNGPKWANGRGPEHLLCRLLDGRGRDTVGSVLEQQCVCRIGRMHAHHPPICENRNVRTHLLGKGVARKTARHRLRSHPCPYPHPSPHSSIRIRHSETTTLLNHLMP
jgi:hypothetical protein